MSKNFFLILTFLALHGCDKTQNFSPDSQLTPQEKDRLMTQVIRYVAKAPENVSDSAKFGPAFNDYYLKKMSEARLEQYYRGDDETFFLISQPASSLIEKRHATGGKLKLNNLGEMVEYAEIFRTWKMTPDTLQARSYFLFHKMVTGEPLSPYYTKNSFPVEYIEFPDDRTYYDVSSRKWRTKR
jgi:hypothetical protein